MNNLSLLSIIIIAVIRQGYCRNIEIGNLNDWENQKVSGINKEYYHVNVVPYPDLKSSLKMDYTQSVYYKSLNGIWKINYVTNHPTLLLIFINRNILSLMSLSKTMGINLANFKKINTDAEYTLLAIDTNSENTFDNLQRSAGKISI